MSSMAKHAQQTSARSQADVQRACKWHVRKLASVLPLLVQLLFVHAKVPLYMLLSKIMMSRLLSNTKKKHTCAYEAGGWGDARECVVRVVYNGCVRVHASLVAHADVAVVQQHAAAAEHFLQH